MSASDLKNRALKSTAWFATTRLGMQCVSWVVTLFLARLLTPSDYGFFGMSLSVITLLELLRELGLGTSIVQRQNIRQNQLNAIFWIITGVSVSLVVLTYFLAPLAAIYYNEPRLIWTIRILGFIFLLNSIGTVPYSLLTKEIDFKKRSLSEAYGVIISVFFSLALAFLGYGVWALVIGHLMKTATQNISMAVYCRWRPTMHISLKEIPEILKFGIQVAGSSAIANISGALNPLIIGRFLGSFSLGIYSMADSLGMNPFHKLSTQVINQMSLPIFSKIQKEDESLRIYFLKISKYLAIISLPLQVGIALLAKDLVPVLLSAKWNEVVELLQVFSIGGLFYIITLPSNPLLLARGKADVTFRYSVISAIMISVGLVIGVQFGLKGVVIGWFLSYATLRYYLLVLSLREISLTMWSYIQNISAPLIATLAMVFSVTVFRHLLISFGTIERLIACIIIGGITYLVSLALADRNLSHEVRGILQEMFSVSRS